MLHPIDFAQSAGALPRPTDQQGRQTGWEDSTDDLPSYCNIHRLDEQWQRFSMCRARWSRTIWRLSVQFHSISSFILIVCNFACQVYSHSILLFSKSILVRSLKNKLPQPVNSQAVSADAPSPLEAFSAYLGITMSDGNSFWIICMYLHMPCPYKRAHVYIYIYTYIFKYIITWLCVYIYIISYVYASVPN